MAFKNESFTSVVTTTYTLTQTPFTNTIKAWFNNQVLRKVTGTPNPGEFKLVGTTVTIGVTSASSDVADFLYQY